MRKTRMIPTGANKFAIRLDSCDDGVIKGAVDGAYLESPIPFESFVRLIIVIDDLLDEVADGELELSAPKDNDFIPTIELEIMFRQNHCWQGRVVWPDREQEMPFRSLLELIFIFATLYDD